MDVQYKNLGKFAAIFVVGAAALFYVLGGVTQPPTTLSAPPSQDSLFALVSHEIDMLKAQADALKASLDAVNKRLGDLEKASTQSE